MCTLVMVAFQQLRRVNISSRALTLFVKMQFFQCVVMSVLLYSGETWAVVKQHIKLAKPVGLIDRIEMRKTDCFGKTRLVLHVPSSS